MSVEQAQRAQVHAPTNTEYLEVSSHKDVLNWDEGRTRELPPPSPSPHVIAPQHIGHVIWGATIASTICLLTAAISIVTRTDTTCGTLRR